MRSRSPSAPLQGAVLALVGEATISLPLEGVIDLKAERARLMRDADKIRKEVAKIDQKLGNEQFMAKAKEEVVEEQRERREEALALLAADRSGDWRGCPSRRALGWWRGLRLWITCAGSTTPARRAA